MPRLFVESGTEIGADYPVRDGMVLGRLEDCDVRIDDPKASRRHARILKQGAQYFIIDLNSSNGTYLNGVLVKKSPLVFGDRIRIGDTILVFTEEPEEDLVGSRIAGFEIGERLGAREIGIVYKARQVTLDRIVALKILDRTLSKDADFVRRFRERAQAAASLRHPNIVQIFDVMEAEGRHFVVMECVTGKPLRDFLKGGKVPFSMEERLKIARQAVEGLTYAHRMGVIHGSITPVNILVTDEKNVKLADFGAVRRDLPLAARDVSSLYYISPEEALGKHPDKQSDIYSLGIVFFHLLTGQLPFKATGALELIREHTEREVPPPDIINSNIPASFADVVFKMCARDPEKRFVSMIEVKNALGGVTLKRRFTRKAPSHREPQPTAPRAESAPQQIQRRRQPEVHQRRSIVPVRRRRRLPLILFLLILIVLFLGSMFAVEFICRLLRF